MDEEEKQRYKQFVKLKFKFKYWIKNYKLISYSNDSLNYGGIEILGHDICFPHFSFVPFLYPPYHLSKEYIIILTSNFIESLPPSTEMYAITNQVFEV